MPRVQGVFALIIIAYSGLVFALPNSAVLPQGVWHPSLRYGIVSEVSNRYDSSGSLQSVGRLNQAFNGETISRYSPSGAKLKDLLNQIFPNSRYADQLYVGSLEFKADATVHYFSPILAFGLTPRLTLALGVPIVNLKAEVHASQTGRNNSSAIKSLISQDHIGQVDQNLENGFNALENANLVTEYEKVLRNKGYIVPHSTDRTVVGDMQVAAVYQYWESPRWTLWEITSLNLPTGPEDDPDDFLDIPIFHQTSLKFDFHQDYRLTSKWNWGTNEAYTWKIPDTAMKRVPKDEDDILPEADRKERVNRDLGDVITLGTATDYWVTEYVDLGVGYEYNYKPQDRYSGGRGYDYGLLSRNTKSEWHRVLGMATFSTVNWYLEKKFGAPLILSYTYSDIVEGTNVDRQQAHEFTFKMFF